MSKLSSRGHRRRGGGRGGRGGGVSERARMSHIVSRYVKTVTTLGLSYMWPLIKG